MWSRWHSLILQYFRQEHPQAMMRPKTSQAKSGWRWPRSHFSSFSFLKPTLWLMQTSKKYCQERKMGSALTASCRQQKQTGPRLRGDEECAYANYDLVFSMMEKDSLVHLPPERFVTRRFKFQQNKIEKNIILNQKQDEYTCLFNTNRARALPHCEKESVDLWFGRSLQVRGLQCLPQWVAAASAGGTSTWLQPRSLDPDPKGGPSSLLPDGRASDQLQTGSSWRIALRDP